MSMQMIRFSNPMSPARPSYGGRVALRFVLLPVFGLHLLILTAIGCGGESPTGVRETEWMYVTAKSGLRLRSEPSTTGTKVALIPPATRVEVLERSDTMLSVDGIEAPWIRVRHQALEGWVFGGYLGTESQGGDAITERDRVFLGVWLGSNLCEGQRSRLEILDDSVFEANLFGGCDVTACQCGPAQGEYRITDGRICFKVTSHTFEIVRNDRSQSCYQIRNGSLVAVGDGGFYENYGSELFTNLVRGTAATADDAGPESASDNPNVDSRSE